MRRNEIMDPDTLSPKKAIVTKPIPVDTVLGEAWVTLRKRSNGDWWEIRYKSTEDRPRFRATDAEGNPVSREKAVEMAKMYAGRIYDSLRGY